MIWTIQWYKLWLNLYPTLSTSHSTRQLLTVATTAQSFNQAMWSSKPYSTCYSVVNGYSLVSLLLCLHQYVCMILLCNSAFDSVTCIVASLSSPHACVHISNLEHWLWWCLWFGCQGGWVPGVQRWWVIVQVQKQHIWKDTNWFWWVYTQAWGLASLFYVMRTCLSCKCHVINTCGTLEECGHTVYFVCLSRLHSTTVWVLHLRPSDHAQWTQWLYTHICKISVLIWSFNVTPLSAWCRLPWWVNRPCWCNQHSDHRRAFQFKCVLRWVCTASCKGER